MAPSRSSWSSCSPKPSSESEGGSDSGDSNGGGGSEKGESKGSKPSSCSSLSSSSSICSRPCFKPISCVISPIPLASLRSCKVEFQGPGTRPLKPQKETQLLTSLQRQEPSSAVNAVQCGVGAQPRSPSRARASHHKLSASALPRVMSKQSVPSFTLKTRQVYDTLQCTPLRNTVSEAIRASLLLRFVVPKHLHI